MLPNEQEIVFYPEQIKAFKRIEVFPMCFTNEFEKNLQLAEPAQEHEKPDFYSVFINLHSGGLECIADCSTKEIAESLEQLLNGVISNYKPFEGEIIIPVTAYYDAVVEYLKTAYGLEAGDLDITEELTAQVQQDGETPVQFIGRLAKKYNLTKRSDFTPEQAKAFMKRFK